LRSSRDSRLSRRNSEIVTPSPLSLWPVDHKRNIL
jgi:hypothetical protein